MPILSAANGNAPCIDKKGLFSVELFETAGLLVIGGFGRIYVHEDTEASEYSHITTLGGHKGPVLSLASLTLLPAGAESAERSAIRDIIISGGEDKALVVWDARLFEEHTRKECAHASSITSITVLDTASAGLTHTPVLITASRDGHIRLWSLPSLTLVHDIGAHLGVVLEVSATLHYSRFQNRPAVLSTGSDQLMKLWKVYRIFNWERRKEFAMFLALCGFIRASSVVIMPELMMEMEGLRCGDEDGPDVASHTTTATSIVGGKGDTHAADSPPLLSTPPPPASASASVPTSSLRRQQEEEDNNKAVMMVFHIKAMCQEIISFL
jgi:WD40 repeat protein